MLDHNPALAYALLVSTGFTVGLFGSFTGLGGAMVLTPMLAIVLGLPYNTAVGCTVAQTIGMALVAVVRYHRLGLLDLRLGVNFIAGSIPGAVLGRIGLQRLHAAWGHTHWLHTTFTVFYVCVLLSAVFTMTWRWLSSARSKRGCESPGVSCDPAGTAAPRAGSRYRRAAALLTIWSAGLFAGGLAGLLAIGGGLVAVPVLSGILAVPVATAVGTSMLQMVFTTLAATATSIGTSDLDARVIALLLLGSIPGAAVGPWLLNRFAHARMVRPAG